MTRLVDRLLCWLNRPGAEGGYCRACGETAHAGDMKPPCQVTTPASGPSRAHWPDCCHPDGRDHDGICAHPVGENLSTARPEEDR